jgi:hypothetical protein
MGAAPPAGSGPRSAAHCQRARVASESAGDGCSRMPWRCPAVRCMCRRRPSGARSIPVGAARRAGKRTLRRRCRIGPRGLAARAERTRVVVLRATTAMATAPPAGRTRLRGAPRARSRRAWTLARRAARAQREGGRPGAAGAIAATLGARSTASQCRPSSRHRTLRRRCRIGPRGLAARAEPQSGAVVTTADGHGTAHQAGRTPPRRAPRARAVVPGHVLDELSVRNGKAAGRAPRAPASLCSEHARQPVGAARRAGNGRSVVGAGSVRAASPHGPIRSPAPLSRPQTATARRLRPGALGPVVRREHARSCPDTCSTSCPCGTGRRPAGRHMHQRRCARSTLDSQSVPPVEPATDAPSSGAGLARAASPHVPNRRPAALSRPRTATGTALPVRADRPDATLRGVLGAPSHDVSALRGACSRRSTGWSCMSVRSTGGAASWPLVRPRGQRRRRACPHTVVAGGAKGVRDGLADGRPAGEPGSAARLRRGTSTRFFTVSRCDLGQLQTLQTACKAADKAVRASVSARSNRP